MPFDTVAIKERVDLVDLVGESTRLSGGAEQSGPCPKCGGTDRFHATAEWWFCRQCHPERGDAIEYIMWRDDSAFAEACQVLGGENTPQTGARRPQVVRQYTGDRATPARNKAESRPRVKHTEAPGDVWQAKARAFVKDCQARLWETPNALASLRGRGLSDATIKAAGLGWHDKAQWHEAADWGKRGAKVWLPRGWTIPCEMGGVLWYVTIRRPAADLGDGYAKYIAVGGSRKSGVVYGLDGAEGCWDIVIAEGEFNCLILRQELAGVAAVVSVGAAGNLPGSAALPVLATIPRWYAAYDSDETGQDGAEKLAAFSERVRALTWPWGELDVNGAHLEGHDLAAWAVPQIGPRDTDKRLAWARHWLDRLDAAAWDAGANDKDPTLRVWLAMLGEHDKVTQVTQVNG